MNSEPTPSQLDSISRLQKERKFAEALRLGTELKAAYPRSHRVRKKLAHVYAAAKQLDEAIREISEAISLAPGEEPDYYFNRGHWCLDIGRYREAVIDCSTAIDIEANIGWNYYTDSAYFIRALAKWRVGNYLGALDDCRHVADDTVFWALGTLQSKTALALELERHLSEK